MGSNQKKMQLFGVHVESMWSLCGVMESTWSLWGSVKYTVRLTMGATVHHQVDDFVFAMRNIIYSQEGDGDHLHLATFDNDPDFE